MEVFSHVDVAGRRLALFDAPRQERLDPTAGPSGDGLRSLPGEGLLIQHRVRAPELRNDHRFAPSKKRVRDGRFEGPEHQSGRLGIGVGMLVEPALPRAVDRIHVARVPEGVEHDVHAAALAEVQRLARVARFDLDAYGLDCVSTQQIAAAGNRDVAQHTIPSSGRLEQSARRRLHGQRPRLLAGRQRFLICGAAQPARAVLAQAFHSCIQSVALRITPTQP